MNRFFNLVIGGLSLGMVLCLCGCLGSQMVMGDVPEDRRQPLTLWDVPNRPSAPDRQAIQKARTQLKDHHTAASQTPVDRHPEKR